MPVLSKPVLDNFFNDFIRFQLRSNDLVIYSISARRIVTIACRVEPNLNIPLRAFQSKPINNAEIGEYFEGYCGEHISRYSDVQQKCGERPNFLRTISRAEATASIALGPYYVPPELIPPP
ncbi:hypothetical protein C0993_005806 [Termitomyces sp. T159_Od127]|nr:hypothetical protein C0993_005806 [Termitomyces sp. T159_Od127]